ncbi:copper homeostasis protein CutC [Aestuariibaculum suncheonense]|uniref:PF03932 family protein CutC n=1 Tax=Aestuariibaculum suncheonense TaxID=1028745 RepID=A0A8J6UM31_9FLAO|nr:copper homeostasis protein CutC [Aestuariibaculum suncheonense]MBD0836641.1 copper homeostasis protein CutC [Aestuariibaculum suncheonense]
MIVEVCANSFESAVNAEKAGAHRIELCSELAVGGITPSFGLIKKVVETLSIPVFVLIRPRSGSFTFSDDEMEIMKHDIKLCKELGCAGIVSGALNIDNTIDIDKTKVLIETSKPLQFTFHRAFDWVPNPEEALEQLKDLGVDRILTSGQESSAEKGLDLLQKLKDKTEDKIHILSGGGIKPVNVAKFQAAGFSEIHVSASTIETVIDSPKVAMNSVKFFDETIKSYSDVNTIKQILSITASEK